jgi:hypothetical protein
MIDNKKLQQAAIQWVDDWNHRNIEQVMSHYSEEVLFYSPTVIRRWNQPKGILVGKSAVERHFRKAMEEVPDIHFEFKSLLFGAESIILIYERETGNLVADLVLFNAEGKINKVRTHYGEIPDLQT